MAILWPQLCLILKWILRIFLKGLRYYIVTVDRLDTPHSTITLLALGMGNYWGGGGGYYWSYNVYCATLGNLLG